MLLSRRLPQEGIEFEMQIVEIITTWLHRSNSAPFASVCFHDIIQKKWDRVLFTDYPQILSVSLFVFFFSCFNLRDELFPQRGMFINWSLAILCQSKPLVTVRHVSAF